jgi:hypothetical protein
VRKPLPVAALAALAVLVTIGAGALRAGAQTQATFFGALLTKQSQPANAESGKPCTQDLEIPAGSPCTWVSVQAYHNGGHEQAPKAGTINQVRVVSCVAGSFRLQLAVGAQTTRRAKIVRNGPVIRYNADPRQIDGDDDTVCGGDDGNDYLIQAFPITLKVNKGELIAIRTPTTGAVYCSGGSGVLLYSPPLAVGAAARKADGSASCNLLVKLRYR